MTPSRRTRVQVVYGGDCVRLSVTAVTPAQIVRSRGHHAGGVADEDTEATPRRSPSPVPPPSDGMAGKSGGDSLTATKRVLWFLRCHWRRIVALLAPVLLSPLLILHDSKDAIMMYLAGMIIAAAVENCNLHYRIALRILLIIGTKTLWLLLGFMFTAMFLSMWLSNMATTLMVLPIVDAVVNEICKKSSEESLRNGSPASGYTNEAFPADSTDVNIESFELQSKEDAQRASGYERYRNAMLLGIAYASNIGGTGSVIGTAPNLVLMGLVEELYPNSGSLSFATWMIYNVPTMIVCVAFAWLYLYFQLVPKRLRGDHLNPESVRTAIRKRYDELGSLSFHEGAVLFIFVVIVLLWFFRDPYVVTGWSSFFALGKKIKDATPAMLLVSLLFLVPARPVAEPRGPALLEWNVVQHKIPWGVLLLMGGSFSMAEASSKSGLSRMLGQYLTRLDVLHPVLLVAVLCIFTTTVTEIASNTATASVLLPITGYLAQALRIHPFFLMIPVTVSASFAFMLPVATPPNAMVYEHGNMKLKDMMKAGIAMNIACIVIEMIAINTLGEWTFGLSSFPAWAEMRNSTVSASALNVTMAPGAS
ncbi:hypothetical protein HPB50_024746 [Hyalomma asiaticum]|uniref:Uncharacterized protein n=1 Tax=Hyalomma asiaticum TaxID=266040 RepID=A0ACB7SIW7_HYAAI|nr:hypothetical protein HPB50_024746 [Hyalomma asiaticum]